MKKKIKIIDILCYISIGEKDKIPKRVKWRDSVWEYDDRNQDYVHKESMLFEQNKFIRTKEFLNDEVEAIEEEKGIEKLDKNFTLEDITDELSVFDWKTSIISKKVNELIDEINQLKRGE